MPSLIWILCSACVLGTASARQDLARRVAEFWAAGTPAERSVVAEGILASGASFDEVHAALGNGRVHSSDAATGRLLRTRTGTNGLRHPYMILVPEDYTPERTWPVRFELHGGMGAKEWRKLDGSWAPGWRPVQNQIVVIPAGWWDSMWWEWSQAENFEAILREVRAQWNIDENRVVACGISDGGAALFFTAMRQPDRFAGYAGYVAPPDRLVRADFRPDGQMHVSNLAGQRFHLGFGEQDVKVPLEHIESYMQLFESRGALLDWYVLDGQDHSLRLPDERERELARFLWGTRRDPLPDTLSWATERTDRYARRSWLVIDELEPRAAGEEIDASNVLPRWGTRIQLRGPTVKLEPWGRVDLERQGNRVLATSLRVRRFTLLLSPDEFDFEQPIVVELNGRVAFEGSVQPDPATLLEWAGRDDDRTTLFAAALTIR